jgi:hypothetical protein
MSVIACYRQLRITQPDELDDGQWGVTYVPTVASRTPLWLLSGWGCRGRRPPFQRAKKVSLWQAHAPQQAGVAWIRMKGLEEFFRLYIFHPPDLSE